MGHTQNEKQLFCGWNKKSRSLAFRHFVFYQNICFGWVMSLFLFSVKFFIKKRAFPAKTAEFSLISALKGITHVKYKKTLLIQ